MSTDPDDAEPNPYAVPESLDAAPAETEHDRFILAEVASMLRPNERVRYTAVLFESFSPLVVVGLFVAVAVVMAVGAVALAPLGIPPPLLGGVGGALGATGYMLTIRPYLAAVTGRRIILLRTGLGAFGPRMQNRGVDEVRWKNVERIEVGGFANNRSLRFVFRDGTARTLRISPHLARVSGQKAFFAYAQQYVPKRPAAPTGAL